MPKLQDVTIVTSTGDRVVRATILGPFAIHASVDAGPCSTRAYTVTHRATGKRVAALPQKRYAIECARMLAATIAWGPSGCLEAAAVAEAQRIIRDIQDRAFFAHCGL